MPLYCYECVACNKVFEAFRRMSEALDTYRCPDCGKGCSRAYWAEFSFTQGGDPVEQYSEAAGVHPSQIEECKRRFPHHDFLPDGRMIFRGQRHKDRCLKDLGFVEYDRPR